MNKFKVVVTDKKFSSYDIEESVLGSVGAVVEVHTAKTPSDVLKIARDADCLLVSSAPITRKVVEGLRNCRGIIRYGVGYDMIDLEAATERGIPVINVPDYCTSEVADHALAFILSLVRKLPQVTAQLKSGIWTGTPCRPVYQLRGRRLGLFGVGRIGQAVINRAKPFGFEIQAFDPFAERALFEQLGVHSVDFEELLRTSQILSLHLPLRKSTHHIIDGPALAKMPEGSFLINVARGGLIDEEALIDALRSGHLGGAALDVFEEEPLVASSPLLKLDNLIATSHCAWYSEASFERLQRFAALEAARLLRGEQAKHVVNGVGS